jgi:hypothetical protein
MVSTLPENLDLRDIMKEMGGEDEWKWDYIHLFEEEQEEVEEEKEEEEGDPMEEEERRKRKRRKGKDDIFDADLGFTSSTSSTSPSTSPSSAALLLPRSFAKITTSIAISEKFTPLSSSFSSSSSSVFLGTKYQQLLEFSRGTILRSLPLPAVPSRMFVSCLFSSFFSSTLPF